MNTVSAQEIKRRGIGAVDDAIKEGPVHVVKNNKLQYVVLTEAHYQELLAAEDEAYMERIKTALADVKAGKVKRFKDVKTLMKQIEKQDD